MAGPMFSAKVEQQSPVEAGTTAGTTRAKQTADSRLHPIGRGLQPAFAEKNSRSVHARIQQLQFSALLPGNSARALLAGIVCRTRAWRAGPGFQGRYAGRRTRASQRLSWQEKRPARFWFRDLPHDRGLDRRNQRAV